MNKHATSEVYPTDLVRLSQHTFLGAVVWPRRHAFYGLLAEDLDVHLLTETARQLMLLTSYLGYSVPLGSASVATRMSIHVRVRPPGTPRVDELVETQPRIRVSDIRSRPPVLILGHKTTVHFDCSPRVFARVSFTTLFLDPGIYRRLRVRALRSNAVASRDRSGLVAPERIGRTNPSDVVLSHSSHPREFFLTPDLQNPYLFDHPHDHIPGMVMIEACRQLVRVVNGDPRDDIGSLSIDFAHPVELTRDTIIRQRPGTSRWRHVEFVQEGIVCAIAKIRGQRS